MWPKKKSRSCPTSAQNPPKPLVLHNAKAERAHKSLHDLSLPSLGPIFSHFLLASSTSDPLTSMVVSSAWNVLSSSIYIDCPLTFFRSLPERHLFTKVPHCPSFPKGAYIFSCTRVHIHTCAHSPSPFPALLLSVALAAIWHTVSLFLTYLSPQLKCRLREGRCFCFVHHCVQVLD